MTSVVSDLRDKLGLVEERYDTLKEFYSLKGKKKYKNTIRSLLDDIDVLEKEITDEAEVQMQYVLSLLDDSEDGCVNCTLLTDMISDLFRICLELNEEMKELNEAIFRLKY